MKKAMLLRMRFAGYAGLALMLTGLFAIGQDSAQQPVDRLVENWRWSHYWFGKTGIDDVYAPGKRINALIFWAKTDRRSKTGLCSTELSACIAYSGPYLSPHAERIRIVPGTTLQQAFASFVNGAFGGDEDYIGPNERLRPGDFDSEERSLTLPTLDAPSSIAGRVVPQEASREAERVRRLLGCGPPDAKSRPSGCGGTLVFAFYGPADPYWFVWRTCAASCEFGGDAIEELTRGDRGWEVTSGGFINSPKSEVERLKQQIQKAEMIRLQL
jgi:hypothetical protein